MERILDRSFIDINTNTFDFEKKGFLVQNVNVDLFSMTHRSMFVKKYIVSHSLRLL